MTNTTTTTKQDNTNIICDLSFRRMLKTLCKLSELGIDATLAFDKETNQNCIEAPFYDTGLKFLITLTNEDTLDTDYDWYYDDEEADETAEYIFTQMIINLLASVDEEIELENTEDEE